MSNRVRAIALAALAQASLGCGPPAEGDEMAVAPPPPSDLRFAFMLDPRLIGPTYAGERWVSPATFTGAVGQQRVEIRVEGAEPDGRMSPVTADWTPSDSEALEVTPGRGARVAVVVKRAGESTVTVAVPGLARELVVVASGAGGTLQVQITPRPVAHPQ